MRSTTSNWTLSFFLILILVAFFYLNIKEVENYRNKILNHYNNLIINSINNHIKHSFNSNNQVEKSYFIKLDSASKLIFNNVLNNYLGTPEVFYIILESKSEKIFLSTISQVIDSKIPKISSEDMFLLHQNSSPQIFELDLFDKDIFEIRSSLQLNFAEPVIIRIGIDFSYLSAPYQNHILNTSIIYFFLLLIIILFINYQDIFNKRISPLSDLQVVIDIFFKISENLTNGVIFIDPQQRIRIFNSVASTITGIDKKTALMNDYFEVFPSDNFNVDEVFNSKKSIGLSSIQLITEKGVNRELYYSTSIIEIHKVFIGVFISIQDVTEINKKIYLETNKKIIEANSNLATGITAAFLNKINRIYLSFQGLTNKKELSTESIKESSDTVLSITLEIEQLLNKFEDLAKIDKVSYFHVSVNDIIEKVIDFYKSECKNKNIQIQKNYRRFLTFLCDEKLLTEIFTVLVENSIDSIDNNGDIMISAEQNATNTIIKISDTGCGIDKSISDNFYLPFNTSKQGHFGFGLAKVHKYITLLTGQISFQTTKGLGTTFTVILPNRYDLKGKV